MSTTAAPRSMSLTVGDRRGRATRCAARTTGGKPRGVTVKSSIATFCRSIETPMAVTRGVSFGALRTGR
jgi:hypothetical protein